MDYRIQLCTLAEAYAEATGRSVARVATIVHNQGQFFDGLSQGKACTVDTYMKVLRWFSENWPEDAAWPEGVPRLNEGDTSPPVGQPEGEAA